MWSQVLIALFAAFPTGAFAMIGERCLESVDPGPCQFFQLKWHWDDRSGECKQFNYGGCLGNRNRFNSKEDCRRQCLHKVYDLSMPGLCLLDPDPGYCRKDSQIAVNSNSLDIQQAQWWYYFNANAGLCQQFLFYGCGSGNNNRFYSLYQCRTVCGERLEPQIACDKCDVRTSYCRFYSKFNASCECRHGYRKGTSGDECKDVDECAEDSHGCGKHALCKNKIGSFDCDCLPGYSGDGKQCTFVGIGSQTEENCSDCSVNATCRSGTCQCRVGFSGDGFNCTDVDECVLSPNVCDANAKCTNTIGSYICECFPGFAGNGFSCTRDSGSCLDRFDPNYRARCQGQEEDWREHYFLDHETKKCSMFWYNGCQSSSRNIFSTLSTCEGMCEHGRLLNKAGGFGWIWCWIDESNWISFS